jgi:pimeloyl-ACP methyl ester carboxylesterase
VSLIGAFRRATFRAGIGATLVGLPLAAAGILVGRGSARLLAAPRTTFDEAALGPALDALGGEVVRMRSRDGVRLAARWLPAESAAALEDAAGTSTGRSVDAWVPTWDEAIVLLHGYTGSVAPDVVKYGPFLRRIAGVLALDFRGHGSSEVAHTTFGLREIEDVAGALAWLGERGIRRVALFGTSMGGIAAIASAVVLGDGRPPSSDDELFAPVAPAPSPRPLLVGLVAESAAPELRVVILNRLEGPARGFLADRLLDGVAARLAEDPRTIEPIRLGPLLEGLPVLLIHGDADTTVPLGDGRRLAEAMLATGVPLEHWIVPGAEHSGGHKTRPDEYEDRVGAFLRRILGAARRPADSGSGAPEAEGPSAILAAPASAIAAGEA